MTYWRRIAALSVAAGISTAIVAEGLVRLFIAEPESTIIDAERGKIPAPHSSRWQTSEGQGHSFYNDLSFRGKRDELPLRAEKRVLILGDSLTEAVEVEEEETFSRLLETRLQAIHPRPLHVINAGRMAYQPGDMLWTAQLLQPKIQSDYAIVVIRPIAFGIDNKQDVILPGFWSRRYTLDVAGQVHAEKIVPETSIFSRYAGLRWLRQHVALLDATIHAFARHRIAHEGAAPFLMDRTLLARRASFFVDSLQDLFQHRLMIVLVNRDNPLGFDPPSDSLEDMVRETLEQICRRKNVAFWYTRPAFTEISRTKGVLPTGFSNLSPPGNGHLNRVGHLIVAERLALWLTSQLRMKQ